MFGRASFGALLASDEENHRRQKRVESHRGIIMIMVPWPRFCFPSKLKFIERRYCFLRQLSIKRGQTVSEISGSRRCGVAVSDEWITRRNQLKLAARLAGEINRGSDLRVSLTARTRELIHPGTSAESRTDRQALCAQTVRAGKISPPRFSWLILKFLVARIYSTCRARKSEFFFCSENVRCRCSHIQRIS